MPTGQFMPGNSILHRLDARTKILCLFILLATVIGTRTVWGYALVLTVVSTIVLMAKVPLCIILAPIRRMRLFLLVIFSMNALFFDAATPLWSWWVFRISQTGIQQGFSVVVHVVLIVVLGSVLTITTAPMEITTALESLIKPLKLIRVPTEDVAMIISVALQFIPTLIEEADMIRKAQIARGARFESKKLTERAASFIPLVVPIFIAAFRRADELSLAIEARGYRGARNRTKRCRSPLRKPDYTALAASTTLCVLQYALLR